MATLEDGGRFPPDARWPNIMATALGPGYEVIAEGHPGRTTLHDDPVEGAHRNGLRVLPAILESHAPIDLVILMLGTNDLKTRFAVTAADIAQSMGRLVDGVRASGTAPDGRAPGVLVVVPPPILEVGELGEMFQGGAVKSRGLSAACAVMAARRDVAVFDAGAVIAVSPLDGIHYEAEAQRALGRALAEAVRARLVAE
jgi:lysophospholipase L1-like esterase